MASASAPLPKQRFAHLVELLAGWDYVIVSNQPPSPGFYAYVLSRAQANQISWNDIPIHEIVGEGPLREPGCGGLAEQLQSELDLQPQKLSMGSFLAVPWARQFFQPRR